MRRLALQQSFKKGDYLGRGKMIIVKVKSSESLRERLQKRIHSSVANSKAITEVPTLGAS
jgi:hypothetical protein